MRLLSDIESTMFRTTAPHHQDPLEPDTLAPELAASVAEARAHTATGSADPAYLETYVRSAMFDAVVALLIRHRLPIDADRTRVVVNRSANNGDHAWVASCAEHIAQIARGKTDP